MILIKTLVVQLIIDREYLKARVNMTDHTGNLAVGKLIPLMKLSKEQLKRFNGGK
jgi:hypothetical protein